MGEIDTRAPFQSVRDAVTLFGQSAFSHSHSPEEKMRLAPFDHLKERLNNAETSKAHALASVDLLTLKLNTVSQEAVTQTTTHLQHPNQATFSFKTARDTISQLDASKTNMVMEISLAAVQAHQTQPKIYAAKKLLLFNQEFYPLETLLTNTVTEIAILQREMNNAKPEDLDSVKIVTSELGSTKDSLHKAAQVEISPRNLLDSLKIELENVKSEHLTLNKNEAETETVAGNLNLRLRKSKVELETCLAEESQLRGDSDEMISTLHSLSLETENARKEAKEMKIKAEDTRTGLREAETTLRVALEEAKAAELKALDQIKALSERTRAARASISDSSSADILITKDEFESLKWKVKESETLAEMKVGATMAQVEAVKASEKEAVNKLEAAQKEIEDMKISTQEALRRVEMSEAAKKAVEGELRRWYERDQKKAAGAAARVLTESAMMSAKESSSPPLHYRIHMQNFQPTKKVTEATPKKYRKAKTLATPKKTHMPSLSGMFSRKKKQIEGPL